MTKLSFKPPYIFSQSRQCQRENIFKRVVIVNLDNTRTLPTTGHCYIVSLSYFLEAMARPTPVARVSQHFDTKTLIYDFRPPIA